MNSLGRALLVVTALATSSVAVEAKSDSAPAKRRGQALACGEVDRMSREELLDALNRAVATGVEGWPRGDTFCLDRRPPPVSELERHRQQRPLKP